jgi:peroxiredoxin
MTTTQVSTYGIGDTVEDFVLPDTDGHDIRLSDVAGLWTVLYFTATWCPYCTAEAPFIEDEVVDRFADRDVRLVVIDVKEPPEVARRLPDRFGWSCPFLIDHTGELSTRFAPQKEGLSPEVAIINAHVVLDDELTIRYTEYLNMERFDAHVTSLVSALDRLTSGASDA